MCTPPAVAQDVSIDGPPALVAPAVVSRDSDGSVRSDHQAYLTPEFRDVSMRCTHQCVGVGQVQQGRAAPPNEPSRAMFDDDSPYRRTALGTAPPDRWQRIAARHESAHRTTQRHPRHFATVAATFLHQPVGRSTGHPQGNLVDWNPVWDARTGSSTVATAEMATCSSLRHRSGDNRSGHQYWPRHRAERMDPPPIRRPPASWAHVPLSRAGTLVVDLPAASKNVIEAMGFLVDRPHLMNQSSTIQRRRGSGCHAA